MIAERITMTVLTLLLACAIFAQAAPKTWDGGGGDAYWNTDNNWNPDGVPGAGDDVAISNSATVYITNSQTIATLLLTNATLSFWGTNTILTVNTARVAGASGKITHPINGDTNGLDGWQASNIVWIICTDLTVAAGASINVNTNGYFGGPMTNSGGNGCGPGGGTRVSNRGGGGGYGGKGGNGDNGAAGGPTNGSVFFPFDPGSGGAGADGQAHGGSGGGVVRIEAGGTVTIDGTVSANGQASTVVISFLAGGGGSGGSIYIRCNTLSGNGTIRANGGASTYGGAGGGGRIAILFNQTNSLALQFLASSGSGANWGRPGTLYLSQYDGVLPETWYGGLELATNCGSWSPQSFTLATNGYPSNVAFAVFQPGFQLSVTGSVRLSSTRTSIELGTNSSLSCTNLWLGGAYMYLQTGTVANLRGGDVTMTNSAYMWIYPSAGFTNVQNFDLRSGTIYPICDATSGVPPIGFWVDNFTVANGCKLDADRRGYAGGTQTGHTSGYGPGGGIQGTVDNTRGGGGGYGGKGGSNIGAGAVGGSTNGSAFYPFDPGSGGAGGNGKGDGGAAGGAVRIEARLTVTVDGSIKASGQNSTDPQMCAGGGAGGGIYISADTFAGNGSLCATGGVAVYGGGGGGGRIAIWYRNMNFSGTYYTNGGPGFTASSNGTLYLGQLPPLVRAGTYFYFE